MTRVLILTTGGSPEPLIKSLKQNKPDYTVFLCSADTPSPSFQAGSHVMVDGPGKEQDSIVARAGLGREYEAYEKILASNPDNLAECYRASLEAIHKSYEKFPGAQIAADYTGGTKTMSAALAMAAIDYGDIELFVVSGPRRDLIKVASGTEMLRQVDWVPILWMRKQKILAELFHSYNYAACIELIDDMARRIPAGSELDSILSMYASICRGFQVWDEFRHEEALRYLKPYGSLLPDENTFLNSIIKARQGYENQIAAAQGKAEGYKEGVKPYLGLVHDILRNAERRLYSGQYDDAVGRIYRALELLAQTVLLYIYPPIYTSDVHIEVLPDEIQTKYQKMYEQETSKGNSRLQLPLYKAYELLYDLGHPLGILAEKQRQEMLNLIQLRNNAIYAHGLYSIPKNEAWKFYTFVCKLLEDMEKEMRISVVYAKQVQFPAALPVM